MGQTLPTKLRSDRALDLALAEMGGYPTTALIVLFFALARRLSKSLDAETASELAYKVADDLATGDR
jgi:hypothetical protein